ncbi:MAG: DUF1269 domain-containing protein [Solirubrobacterales bacterium]
MSELVVVGYNDESTAAMAELEARAAGPRLIVDQAATASVVRDGDGSFIVQTSYHPVISSITWGMLWQLLFGSLFFIPVLGMSVGPGLTDLMARVDAIGLEDAFADQVREMVQPGTSALFLVTADAGAFEIEDALGRFGGRAMAVPLSTRGTQDLQGQLHGATAATPGSAPP